MNQLLAGVLIIILSPIYLLLILLVWVFIGTPILFKQRRPGLHEKIFVLIKFRTMRSIDNQNTLDKERLTQFGQFLRSTSLDELPSLFNIIKGEMNFVGPRPLLVEYLPRYSKDQRRRHEVKPGLTGWAQVNGRNAITWEQKFKLDVWYVDNQSFWLDVKILLLTIKKVFIREGISAENDATMPPFIG